MTEPHVAAADGADTPGIADLIREVYAPFATAFAPTALRWTAGTVRPGEWLTARAGGRLVGAVRHGPDEEGYTFDALAVAPASRARGVGTALVAAVERLAAGTPAGALVIVLRDTLPANARFFTALGYARDRPYPPAHHVYTKRIGARG